MSALTTRELAAAEVLVELYRERFDMTHEMALHPAPTGLMAEAVIAKGDELVDACEVFRRDFHPKQHRVFVGLSQVWASSRTARSSTLLFDGTAK